MRKVGSCILVACAAFVAVGECGAPVASSRSGAGDLAAVDARTGGAMVEATQKFTDFMLAAFVPQIEEAVKAVQIADIGGKSSGFDYHVTGMSIRSVDFSRATVAFKETQGLAIHFPFSISIGGSWKYKLHSFPHLPQGKGKFTAGAGAKSHLDVLFVVGAKGGKPTVSVAPDSLQCSLDLQVHTSGSLFSWLYNLIVKAFKGKIKSQICSAATGSIPSIVNGILGPTLAALDLTVDVPLPPVMQRPGFALALDLQFSSPPIITSSSIAVPIRSELINTARPVPVPPPPSLPVFGAGETSMLSAEVESWAFNRALAVFHGAGFHQYTVLPTALPADSPVQLTTKAFAPFAPELATKYPDSKPIEVFVNVTAPPTMSLNGGKLILTGPTSFGFNVVSGNASSSSTPAFTLQCPLSVGADFSMTNQTFRLKFEYNGCTLALQHSDVGVVHPLMLGTLLNFIINKVFVPAVNAAVAGGFELPPLGGVTLSNSQVTLANESVFIGADLTWTDTACHCTPAMHKTCAPALVACLSSCQKAPWTSACTGCLAKYPVACCGCVGRSAGLKKCPCTADETE